MDAIPDTGASGNFIAAYFARSLGLEISAVEDELQTFTQANGTPVTTIGVATAPWRFANEVDLEQPCRVALFVLADCVFDLILGHEFLAFTKTLTDKENKKRRMSWLPKPTGALYVRNVNILGFPKFQSQRLRGTIRSDIIIDIPNLGAEKFLALPDSGSETNLVSFDYVKKRGWMMDVELTETNLLQFADGSTQKTEGQITLSWYFGHGPTGNTISITFDVLDGCSHNLVLGLDFLEATEAYSDEQAHFESVNAEKAGFSLVILLPKQKNIFRRRQRQTEEPTNSQQEVHTEAAVLDELERRATAMNRLRKLNSNEELKLAIKSEEAERQNEWDESRAGSTKGKANPSSSSFADTSSRTSLSIESNSRHPPK